MSACPTCGVTMSPSPAIGGPMLCADPRCVLRARKDAHFGESLADALKADQELLRRRFVHHTRPKHPLSLREAMDLSRRMSGTDE